MSRNTRLSRTPQDTPRNRRRTWDLPHVDGLRTPQQQRTPEHYRKTDHSDTLLSSSPRNDNTGCSSSDEKSPLNGQTYLTTFGKSVSLERRSMKSYAESETKTDGGRWAGLGGSVRGTASVPASPRRILPPPPGPSATTTTPSLWRKIFSFSRIKSAASSERDISDVGRSNTMPSFRDRVLQNHSRSTVYSEYDINTHCSKENGSSTSNSSNSPSSQSIARNNSICGENTLTPNNTRGSGRRFARAVNRLITDLKQSAVATENPSNRSYPSYRRSCSDSKAMQPVSKDDITSATTSSSESFALLSPESRRKAMSVIDINGNDSDKEVETLVQVRRYKCLPSPVHRQLSNNSSCSTPPLVRFSSDEDITSVHSKRSSFSLSEQSDDLLLDQVMTGKNEREKEYACDQLMGNNIIKRETPVDQNDGESMTKTGLETEDKACDKTMHSRKGNEPCSPSRMSTRKSQSQRASSPVQWIKNKYRDSRSRTPSPHKGGTHCGAERDVPHGSQRVDRTVASFRRLNSNSSETGTYTKSGKVKTKIELKCSNYSEVFSGNQSNVGGTLQEQKDSVKKTTLHQMSHPPTVKPRPKVKRSVSYSPARQVSGTTISAELEERISKLLREPPPAVRRRESMGETVPMVRMQQVNLGDRFTTQDVRGRGFVPRRCNSMVTEHLTCDKRPPILLRSLSGNGATNSTTSKNTDNKLLPHFYIGSSQVAKRVDKLSPHKTKGWNELVEKEFDDHHRCRACCKKKSCDDDLSTRLVSIEGSCCHSNQTTSASATASEQLYPSVASKSRRSLAFTRHRHHTVEIGSDLATAKYMEAFLKARGGGGDQIHNPNKAIAAAAVAASSSLECSSCSQVPIRCKHSTCIDLVSVKEKDSSKTTTLTAKACASGLHKTKGESGGDSYSSLPPKKYSSLRRRRQQVGHSLYTEASQTAKNSSDNGDKQHFQSNLLLHLGNSSSNTVDKVDEASLDNNSYKDTTGANNRDDVFTGHNKEYKEETAVTHDINMEGKSSTQSESKTHEGCVVKGSDKQGDGGYLLGQLSMRDNNFLVQAGSQEISEAETIVGSKTDGSGQTQDVIKTDAGTTEDDKAGSLQVDDNTQKILIQVTGAPDTYPDSVSSTLEICITRTPVSSPERRRQERPKSEILCVKWADESEILEVRDHTSEIMTDKQLRKRSRKERPKSELGGRQLLAEALKTQAELQDGGSDSSSVGIDQSHLVPWDKTRLRQRRMSTPHPIKMRPSLSREPSTSEDDASQSSSSTVGLLYRMKRCRSAPTLDVRANRKRRVTIFQASSAHAGDLALQPIEFNDTSDDELTSEETASLGGHSLASSGSGGRRPIDQLFEEDTPTFAEALWDHVTLDLEELAFQVGEVIQVTDRSDKDWWYGVIEDRVGWFPAAFVRIHVNQMDTADDFVSKVKMGHMTNSMALQRYSSTLLSKEQARTNVVTEIIHAEKEYVKHLKDVMEGYVEKARKRPEMFPDCMLSTIFSNIEEIYKFSSQFLQQLDKFYQPTAPHLSEIGKCFLVNRKGFEIYSEYCNNHPAACEELRALQKNQKYKHFFEACRLLQQMIEIPLEGFLLTPVQKICKYPLQLKELLKYTPPEHQDCRNLQEALESMRHIAMLINERKRKLESLEKLTEWQGRVEDWEGTDLISQSSELIHSGEMTKVNSNGWHQDRVFFLFDHQIVYCKKDLLWRDLLIYRGRINLDHCEVHSIQDGKDVVYNTVVKNGVKIYDQDKDKWYLMYCKSVEQKDKWLNAFQQERHRVMLDRANGFDLEEYRGKVRQIYLNSQIKKDKKKHLSTKDVTHTVPPRRQLSTTEAFQYAQSHDKKTGLLPFLKRKIKR